MSTGADRSDHSCHAADCDAVCRPEFLMCPAHWRMVPYDIQARVYAHYRRGQCDDKRPSLSWISAAKEAVTAVGKAEGKPVALINRQLRVLDVFVGAAAAAARNTTTTTPTRR